MGYCAFTSSVNPRIGTMVSQNPPVPPARSTSDGNMHTLCMRTLCTGSPGKNSQHRPAVPIHL